jgi:uncharacterized protein (TIGR03435 family)
MRIKLGRTVIAGVLLACAARGVEAQSAPATKAKSFEVASVRPSPPLDMQKMAMDIQAGKMPNIGMHINGLRAEYHYLTLRDLIMAAYKAKPGQVTGPSWLTSDHFDIVATMPEGSTRDDAPAMLQTLLADRFKLVVHRETKDHNVLALVVAKGGPKMKESLGEATDINTDEPLKPGEMQMDTPEGPARMTMNKNGAGATMNMGKRGIITYGLDPQTGMLQMKSSKTTMTALADMLTQMMTQLGGGADHQVVDMTGLTGGYEVSMEFSMQDMIAAARAQGMDIPGGPAAKGPTEASDPGSGGTTIAHAVDAMGLKLEQRKAPVEQIVVDSAEKAPTEN